MSLNWSDFLIGKKQTKKWSYRRDKWVAPVVVPFLLFFYKYENDVGGRMGKPGTKRCEGFPSFSRVEWTAFPSFSIGVAPMFYEPYWNWCIRIQKTFVVCHVEKKRKGYNFKEEKKMTWSPYCTCELYCLLWPSYKILYKGISFVLDFVQLFFFLAFALGVLGWLQISCAVQSAGKRAAASAVPYFVPIVFSCYEEEDPLPDICFSFVREKKKTRE